MNRLPFMLTITAAFSFGCFAASPIATMSSPDPFTIDGHSVAAPGVSSWPVVIGDRIDTSTGPGTMLFHDGSSVRLAPKSVVRLTGTTTRPKLILMAGNLDYKLSAESKLELTNSESGQPEPGKTADQSAGGTVSGPSGAVIAVQNVSHAAVIAGVLSAAAIVAALPVVNAVHGSPASIPPISAQ